MKYKVGDLVHIKFRSGCGGRIPLREHNIKHMHPDSLPGPYRILSFNKSLKQTEILIKKDDIYDSVRWWVNTSSLVSSSPKTGNQEIDFLDMLHFNRWSL